MEFGENLGWKIGFISPVGPFLQDAPSAKNELRGSELVITDVAENSSKF